MSEKGGGSKYEFNVMFNVQGFVLCKRTLFGLRYESQCAQELVEDSLMPDAGWFGCSEAAHAGTLTLLCDIMTLHVKYKRAVISCMDTSSI
eukprot:4888595-Amphidinium_carterae.1